MLRQRFLLLVLELEISKLDPQRIGCLLLNHLLHGLHAEGLSFPRLQFLLRLPSQLLIILLIFFKEGLKFLDLLDGVLLHLLVLIILQLIPQLLQIVHLSQQSVERLSDVFGQVVLGGVH